MAVNQYLAFGTGAGANVLTNANYAALATRLTGFVAGEAISKHMNSVWRQSSMVAASVGQIIANAGINATDDGDVAALVANIIAALNATLSRNGATGVVEAFAGSIPPSGALECAGQSLDRTTYAALFAVIGVNYGFVDSTHFNLPDMRGQFMRGWSHGASLDAGRALGTTQGYSTAAPVTNTVSHISDIGVTALTAASNPSKVGFARAARSGESVTTIGVDGAQPVLGETDLINVATGDAETRPVNLSFMFIIWL